MTGPIPNTSVLDISPYVGGEASAPGVERTIRLASNEGAFGPSPAAVEAFRASGAELHRYPEGSASRLRDAIGRRFGLDPARIICGNGSDELLHLLAQAFAGPGTEILHTRHGFLVYPIAARACGATPIAAPETDLCCDVDALLARVTERTRIVFIANPNNPTGSYITADELARLQAGLPPHVLLVVDAAYAEYVSANDYSDGTALVERCANVVMTRTFSKIFALGGARLGWMYAPAAIIDAVNRIRGPFNTSGAAQAAGIAALEDVAFQDYSRTQNDQNRDRFAAAVRELGLTAYPSVGNFLLIDFAPLGRSAEEARLFLKARGILVRQVGAYGLPTCLRVTIGTAEDMDIVTTALTDWVRGG
jgi:histidinol-phosphate aminotransferase